MRCLPECYHCLKRLASRCASLAATSSQEYNEALGAALAYLKDNFSLDSISTDLAGELQRIIRFKSKNSDPFLKVKEEEISLARQYTNLFSPPEQASLQELVQFAAKGNGFDFFQDLQVLKKQFEAPVELARDETVHLSELLRDMLRNGDGKIIYLADNAGECFFDMLLVNYLEQRASVYYAVKESATQNDLTLLDLKKSGIIDRFSNVVSTGTDSPGLDLTRASASFKKLLKQASLVIAKGMAHFETLTELSLTQPVFIIFQIKCDPVAQISGLARQSYAAYFLN